MLARTQVLLSCALVLAAFTSTRVHAETVIQVDLGAPQPGELIQHYVILCARKSDPWGTGHSFVVWAKHNQRTNQTDSRGYGFYPGAQRVLVNLAGGKGQLLDEAGSHASIQRDLLTHRLIFHVDKARFDASWSAKQQWESSRPHYNLFARNCTHFAHRVSTSLGLEPPEPMTGERPPFYFERLVQFCRELP